VAHTVTLAEAAAITGVSVDTVKRRIKRGELPAQKVGKNYRIARADLDASTALQELISNALLGVSEQIQQLAALIEQREQATAGLEKAATALITKAVN